MNIDWSFHAQDQLADILRTDSRSCDSQHPSADHRDRHHLGQVADRRFYSPVPLKVRRVGEPLRSM